ncbi:DUF4424 family protein [candidate division WOR-3 bacterium]|nr:DUF4424 family protein [candidate division WOR-3 bacterium]
MHTLRGFSKSIILLIITTTLLLTTCKSKKTLPVQFYREDIHVWIDEGEVTVEGVYYYRNRTDKPRTLRLLYPFPIDSLHLYPHEINVLNSDYKKTKKGITYDIVFEPKGLSTSTVVYKQKILSKNAKYILTTARTWKEPIKQARFVVSLPEDFECVSMSYEPDSIINKFGRIFYYVDEEELFPYKDIDIVWE